MDSQPRRAHYFAEQSIVCYTLLISLSFASHLLPKFLSMLSTERFVKKTFSTCIRLHFSASFILFFSPFLFLRVHERQIISLLILESFNLFAGVFRKSFLLPHYNWKVTSRLLGYFTKILQKNCREIFPTTAYKKEVRYNSNFLFRFY